MIDAVRRSIAGDKPVFLLIAGPNGASKSTFSKKRLKPLGLPCIDPDAVAKELFGRYVENRDEAIQATVEASIRARKHLLKGKSIALESVFSDRKGYKLGLLEESRRAGFKSVLIFIGVDSPEICIARIQDRVTLGGHDVPDNIIRDRFPRCFANLRKALAKIDVALLIDNSGCYGPDAQEVGSRHYMFGFVEAGIRTDIVEPLPDWFTRFGIADVI